MVDGRKIRQNEDSIQTTNACNQGSGDLWKAQDKFILTQYQILEKKLQSSEKHVSYLPKNTNYFSITLTAVKWSVKQS